MQVQYPENISTEEVKIIARSLLQCPDLFASVQYAPFHSPHTDFEEVSFDNWDIDISNRQPFGKKMETILEWYFENHPNFELLQKGIQITHDKKTLGELDFLVRKNQEVQHIELASKFYLYDDTLSEKSINNWIGPNRKDFLHMKVSKLVNSQLPLLYHPITQKCLETVLPSTPIEAIQQQVAFKAQLYVSLHGSERKITEVNKACLVGIYCIACEIEERFGQWEFTVPEKLFWMCPPERISQFQYRNMNDFSSVCEQIMTEQRAQLIWLKNGNQYLRVFATYW